MAFKEYKPGTAFIGVLGRTFDVSSPAWPEPLLAREGAPNILSIVTATIHSGMVDVSGDLIKNDEATLRMMLAWQ